MELVFLVLSAISIATYITIILGTYFVLRQKMKLGYVLLVVSFLYDVVFISLRISVDAGVNALFYIAIFMCIVAWFGMNYELKKKVSG